MDTNEIIANEEVIETAAEEITKASSGSALKVAAGFGLGVLAGMLICKYAVKPITAKILGKKEQKEIVDEQPVEESTEGVSERKTESSDET